jgi:hypothetical protein
MVFTERDITRVAETNEELLIFDVSEDALERSAAVESGRAITWIYSTECSANCGCPV